MGSHLVVVSQDWEVDEKLPHGSSPHGCLSPFILGGIAAQPAKIRVRLWVSLAYVICEETGKVAREPWWGCSLRTALHLGYHCGRKYRK